VADEETLFTETPAGSHTQGPPRTPWPRTRRHTEVVEPHTYVARCPRDRDKLPSRSSDPERWV